MMTKNFTLLAIALIVAFSCSISFSQSYSDWSSEKQESFRTNAVSLIDRIFPKLVSEEGWFWDKYRPGSIYISDVTTISSDKVVLKGTFGFNSSSNGELKATAKILGYTIIITELCNKYDGSCHNSTDWGSTTFSNPTSSSSSSSSITSETVRSCPDCSGGGYCSRCGRTGRVSCISHDTNGDGNCTNCNNTGYSKCYKCYGKAICNRCSGTGKI